MEMLLYQSTQFRDVKKILDRAHGFAGLLTAGGIEASRLDVPFVCDQKVLSRYDDACSDVRRILTMQLGLTLPKGFSKMCIRDSTDRKYGLTPGAATQLLKLFMATNKSLEDKKIDDVFDDEFYATNFWTYWQTMFAFEKLSLIHIS